jgi:hypothetical protein
MDIDVHVANCCTLATKSNVTKSTINTSSTRGTVKDLTLESKIRITTRVNDLGLSRVERTFAETCIFLAKVAHIYENDGVVDWKTRYVWIPALQKYWPFTEEVGQLRELTQTMKAPVPNYAEAQDRMWENWISLCKLEEFLKKCVSTPRYYNEILFDYLGLDTNTRHFLLYLKRNFVLENARDLSIDGGLSNQPDFSPQPSLQSGPITRKQSTTSAPHRRSEMLLPFPMARYSTDLDSNTIPDANSSIVLHVACTGVDTSPIFNIIEYILRVEMPEDGNEGETAWILRRNFGEFLFLEDTLAHRFPNKTISLSKYCPVKLEHLSDMRDKHVVQERRDGVAVYLNNILSNRKLYCRELFDFLNFDLATGRQRTAYSIGSSQQSVNNQRDEARIDSFSP